jgi:hypothetical protein
MSTAFFSPVGPTYDIAFTTDSANVLVPPTGNGTMSTVRINNNSGNTCFVSFTTSAVGNIDHPTPGAGNSQPVVCIPNGETTFLATGITAPGNVYINSISKSGTGNIFIQAGTL